jgi:hypothetical protein
MRFIGNYKKSTPKSQECSHQDRHPELEVWSKGPKLCSNITQREAYEYWSDLHAWENYACLANTCIYLLQSLFATI